MVESSATFFMGKGQRFKYFCVSRNAGVGSIKWVNKVTEVVRACVKIINRLINSNI